MPIHLFCCGRRGVAPQRHLSLRLPIQTRSRGGVQTKTFRKDSEASSRAERWRGYVILFSNEPSCCYVATSERRRIRLKADYHCFALRGASIRRSQRSNSEAVLFRGTLPRRYSIRRSRWDNALTVKHDYHQHPLQSLHTCVLHLLLPTRHVGSPAICIEERLSHRIYYVQKSKIVTREK